MKQACARRLRRVLVRPSGGGWPRACTTGQASVDEEASTSGMELLLETLRSAAAGTRDEAVALRKVWRHLAAVPPPPSPCAECDCAAPCVRLVDDWACSEQPPHVAAAAAATAARAVSSLSTSAFHGGWLTPSAAVAVLLRVSLAYPVSGPPAVASVGAAAAAACAAASSLGRFAPRPVAWHAGLAPAQRFPPGTSVEFCDAAAPSTLDADVVFASCDDGDADAPFPSSALIASLRPGALLLSIHHASALESRPSPLLQLCEQRRLPVVVAPSHSSSSDDDGTAQSMALLRIHRRLASADGAGGLDGTHDDCEGGRALRNDGTVLRSLAAAIAAAAADGALQSPSLSAVNHVAVCGAEVRAREPSHAYFPISKKKKLSQILNL